MKSNRGGGSFDRAQNMAKPAKHDNSRSEIREKYEHPDITDNRLTWEVLEEGDANG